MGYEYQQRLEYWQENRINQTTKNAPIRFNRDLIIYEEVNQNPPPNAANHRLPPATKTKKTDEEIKRDAWDACCYLAIRFVGFLITVYVWIWMCLFIADYIVWYDSAYTRALFDSLLHFWCAIRGYAYAARSPKCNVLLTK